MPSLPLLTLLPSPGDWGQDKAASEGALAIAEEATEAILSPGLHCLTFTLGGNTLHRARVRVKRETQHIAR